MEIPVKKRITVKKHLLPREGAERRPCAKIAIFAATTKNKEQMPESTQKPRARRGKKERIVAVEDELGRLQPQALDLETAVLGALMLDRNAFAEVSETLKPESFYDKRNQLVFTAIRDLALRNLPIDMLTVREQLKQMGKLDEAGGAFYIAQLTQKMASTAHLDYHAKIIQQKYMARELITFAAKVQEDAFDESQDVDELMQQAEADLFSLSQENAKKDFTQIDPVLNTAYTNLRKAAERHDGLSGIASGFTDLDKITSGWQDSDLIILAARPAMGKTAFALSMAKNMAIDNHVPVGFFSLEMSNVQLVNRLISNVCEIKGEKLKNGQLEPYEWIQLDKQIKRLYGAPLYIDDTPSLTIFEFRTKARRLVREHGVKIIMIDYLQLMDAGDSRIGNRQEAVATISRGLKTLAKELNIPIIALSQVNREAGKREGDEGKKPQLTDLRESGAIEQDADMVCFIHRPEYYHLGGEEMKGKAVIIIAKHRNGGVGEVNLRFRAVYASFENLGDSLITPGYVAPPAADNLSASTDISQAPTIDDDSDPFAGPTPGDTPF